jgi:hypothetical protein
LIGSIAAVIAMAIGVQAFGPLGTPTALAQEPTLISAPTLADVSTKFLGMRPARAEEMGYAIDAVCVSAPPGVMGYHAGIETAFDSGVSALEPEIVMIAPYQGRFQVVGVEYESMADTANINVLGQDMPLLPEGHPGMEFAHYAMHVWLVDNPSGTFADFNPALSCDPETETATLEATGGALSFAQGDVSVTAPDGVVTADVELEYTPAFVMTAPAAAPEGMVFGSNVFALAVVKDGVDQPAFAFKQLVSVTVRYTDDDLAVAKGGRDDSIRLYVYDAVGGGWLPLGAVIPDVVNKTLTASITGPVTLALVVTPEPQAAPAPEPTAVPEATAAPAELALGGGYVAVRGGIRR